MTRGEEVTAIINSIVDPCSNANGTPIGLVDMGIVDGVKIDSDRVRLRLLPTFPACRFIPIFEREIRRRLLALAWSK